MGKFRRTLPLAIGCALATTFAVSCSSFKPYPMKSSSYASSTGSAEFRYVPTTTVTMENSNNTSASSAYTNRYQMFNAANAGIGINGAGGICTSVGSGGEKCIAGHVSSIPIGSMFSQPNKIYVYMQSWFESSPSNISGGVLVDNAQAGMHSDIGYNSAANVSNQIADMKRRGISGAVINWYSPSKMSGQATAAFRDAAEGMLDSSGNPTFWFATGPDKGAFNCTTDCTGNAVSVVETIYANYITGVKSYIRDSSGHPILYWFVDSGSNPSVASIDWQAVKSTLAAKGLNPIFIFDKTSTFSNGNLLPGVDGAYPWITTGGSADFTSFLNAALSIFQNNSSALFAGGLGAGFNDTHAPWGSNRVLPRLCGISWMNSITTLAGKMNSLPYKAGIGIATWDDYEEGSEIETGIDNCVSAVNLSSDGLNLNWGVSFYDSVNGSERTINNYTVYISADGQNLMKFTSFPTTTHSVNLNSLGLPTGTWKIFIGAIGQPSISDHLSGPVTWTASGVGNLTP